MTPLSSVIDILESLKSASTVFDNNDIPVNISKLGVIQASIDLGENFSVDDNNVITADLSQQQIYICGLYAYKVLAMQEHEKYSKKAVNFKTISFAVTGLGDRASQLQKLVDKIDVMIDRAVNNYLNVYGAVTEMKDDDFYDYEE